MKHKPRTLDSDSYAVKSIDRAFQILNGFSFERTSLTLGEFNDLVGLSKPTLFRILQTLVKNRIVSYDSGSGKYSLAVRLFELGEIAISSMSLRQAASPALDDLEKKGGYPALVGILTDGEMVYIDGRRGRYPVALFGTHHGKRQAPHVGAVGKALMAYLPDADIEELLMKYPLKRTAARSITDPTIFKGHLRETRRKGYAYEEGELVEGVIGIAAPIRNYLGKVIAAVGTVFPAFQADSQKKRRMTELVTEAATKISEAMGYTGGGTAESHKHSTDSEPRSNDSFVTKSPSTQA